MFSFFKELEVMMEVAKILHRMGERVYMMRFLYWLTNS